MPLDLRLARVSLAVAGAAATPCRSSNASPKRLPRGAMQLTIFRQCDLSRYAATACVVILLAGALVGPSFAQQSGTYRAIGIGIHSCAFWLSDPRRTNEGIAYMYGAVTVFNMTNPRNNFIGSADPNNEGMIGELKKICTDRPSKSLIDAIAEVYMRMLDQAK